MPHAIARIAKLKGGGIAASEQHTKRQRETPNANPEIQNIRFIGQPDTAYTPDLETLVRQRIGNQTIRKNAVECVEMVLTASPEYFRPDDPGRAGYYHPQQLESFQQAVHQWLDEKYGDRIVRAELHLDEATPHIHAYLVPLDEKGKLNCRALFGGREKLSKFQDSYALAMAPLGLERGIKGSRATHTEVKEYYAAVTQPPDLTLDFATIHHQLADRQRAIKEKEDLERTAKALAKEKEVLQQRLSDLEFTVHAQKREVEDWKTKYTDLANSVRDLPLEQVAYELGLDPDPKDKHKWQHENHTINITGSKFYDWQHLKGGGGAIDLVMHVNSCDFKQAVAWLNDRFGEGATLIAATYKTREIIQTEQLRPFIPPTPNVDKWQQVKAYLTRGRRLPSSLVDHLHQQGLIYADSKQNAVFIRQLIIFAGKRWRSDKDDLVVLTIVPVTSSSFVKTTTPKQRERYPMSKLSTQHQSNSAEESQQNLGNQVANLFLILAVIVAILGFLIDWKNTLDSGAVDLRNRVVAARLLIGGIDPYYFKWHPGIADLFLDPIVDPSWPVSRATIPPTVVVLHAAMAKLPYLTQKIVWFALQWGLFLSSLIILTKRDQTSQLKSKFILILGLLFFSGSFFWRFHVERGQIYILYVFLLSCAYWLTRNCARKNQLLSGFLVGLTASLRPPLFLMSVPMVVYRQWVFLIGTAVGLFSGLLFSFILADVGTWNSYFSAMKIYQKAHLGLLEVKTVVNADNVNTESPVPIEGLTNLTKALDFPASDTSFPSIFQNYFGLNLSANILMLCLGITLLAICFYLYRNRSGARRPSLVFLLGMSIVLLAEHFLPSIRATYNNVQYILPFSIIVAEMNLVELFQNKASLLLLIGLLFNLGFSWIPDSVLIGDLTMLLYALVMSLSIAKNC